MNPMQSPNTGVGGKDFGGKRIELTCDDCWLKGKSTKKGGHCYMAKNWPDNNICREFRRENDKAL